MGLLVGDLLPWERWWLPVGQDPALWNGLLPDPTVGHNRWLNRERLRLADTAEVRARVLLAEGGMGKSIELGREVDRLRSVGEYVTQIDLGACATTGEVRDAVVDAGSAWEASGVGGDLVLALDGFDEPLVDIINLADVLKSVLARLDRQRLRVIVACRTSLWSPMLNEAFRYWWSADHVLSLQLAPLTASDLRLAARSEGLDGDAFVAAVDAAGAGPLAARPITLRLMLAAARVGEFPSRQLEAYRAGVAALAAESGVRRLDRRHTGAPVEARLRAARKLAAVSLLSGRPTIVRRASSTQTTVQLALDEVAEDADDLAVLDDVWDCALLSGTDSSRGWSHHSIAEYLSAELLAELPVDTVWSLLAAPGDPSRLRPQLEQTAAWTASIGQRMFNLLTERRPQLLLNADLRGRPEADRERVGRAVIERMRADYPLTDRTALDALDYPGIDTDLRLMLQSGEPKWRRREAIIVVAATGLRSLDDALLDLVVHSQGHDGYDDEIELAVYAAHALDRSDEATNLDRMRSLVGDAKTPLRVRGALATSLFPDKASAKELAQLLPPADRFAPAVGRTVMSAMRQAVTTGRTSPEDVLDWFDGAAGQINDAATDQATRELAATAVLAALAIDPVGTPRWHIACRVVAWLLGRPTQRSPGPPRPWIL